jgi:hypothetical protein
MAKAADCMLLTRKCRVARVSDLLFERGPGSGVIAAAARVDRNAPLMKKLRRIDNE